MTNRKTAILLSIFVVLPMIIGGMVYVLARPTNIILFTWLNNIGFENFIISIRSAVTASDIMNNWTIYNSPAFFWSFSFTCFLGIIWNFHIDIRSISMFLIPMCLGIVTEILQKTDIINGTFDIIDIILYIAGGLLGLFIINIINHKTKTSVT